MNGKATFTKNTTTLSYPCILLLFLIYSLSFYYTPCSRARPTSTGKIDIVSIEWTASHWSSNQEHGFCMPFKATKFNMCFICSTRSDPNVLAMVNEPKRLMTCIDVKTSSYHTARASREILAPTADIMDSRTKF